MDNEDLPNENWLKEAVDKLRSQGVIKRDKEIAERTGYSPESVSNMISGKVNVSDKFKRKFRETFKEELVKGIKKSDQDEPETTDLKNKYIKILEEAVVLLKMDNQKLTAEVQELKKKLEQKGSR